VAFSTADRVAVRAMVDDLVASLRGHGASAGGGVTRLVYSQAWAAAMAEIEGWLGSAGLEVRVDAAGSRFGRLAGERPQVVMSGSHVDSVVGGGAYDGALGVAMAACAVRWLRETAGRPRLTLEVLANCEEESSRFACNFWGSRAMLGLIRPGECDLLRDADGVTIGEAMSALGLVPDRIAEARRDDVCAYVEPHIEQGPLLERLGLTIGVVDRVVGVRQLRFELRGEAGHAGTIPMAARRDALTGAAELVLAGEALARDLGQPAVATVGALRVEPGGANQVPGRVDLTVDFRHVDERVLAGMEEELRRRAAALAAARGLELSVEPRLGQRAVDLDGRLCALLEASCRRAGVRWQRMPSHAGHDAQLLATRWPSAMLFLPCAGGRSHRPDERADMDDVVRGVEVLALTLHELAYEA